MRARPTALFILPLMLLSAGLGGCKSDFSPSFEAFSSNKLAVLARNVESARDAQNTASDQVTTTVQTIRNEAWTGADPAQAYELARRLESATESRIRTAHNRIKVVKNNGEEFFRQWAKENTEYDDKDLKESSRQNRIRVRASFDAAIAQMRKADAATGPVLVAIRDQVLFLKHHRNAARVPERPAASLDPATPAEALAEQTAVASRLAGEFAASARATPK